MTRIRLGLVASAGFIAILCSSSPASAQVSPSLGNAGTYAVLAGTQVTNTGATTIQGDVGISPGPGGPGTTGFASVTLVGGSVHDADGAAALAMGDKNAAYTSLGGQACTVTYAGAFKELAGANLVPGVYCADRFFLSGGPLILTGSASDTWVFKSAADLIITGGAAARVISPSCNVWWRLVSSGSFDAGSSLTGNILADTSITLAAGATLIGKALARTANVTLSSNTITACSASVLTPTPTPAPTPRPNVCATTAPDLFLTKRHTDTFVAGANASYSISLGNNGTTITSTTTVADTLPNGLSFVSASGTSWTCAAAGQVVNCTSPSQLPGPITLTVRPTAAAVPSVTNVAVVTGGGDCDVTNNSSSDVTLVAAGPTPVPTLSEWAFIMLGTLLAAAGVVTLRRRTAL